jgi:hypothetical protein
VLTFYVALRRRLKPDLIAPSLHCISVIFPCVSQHRWQNVIGQKKAPSHSLAIIQVDCTRPPVQAELFALLLFKTLLL